MEKVNEDASLEFKWLKKRGVGGKNKEVQFYESFIYDGVEYMLYDCVYMHKEGLREPYIGKLIKIWERPDKSKKVKVHWFFRPEEISKWLGETKTIENEIFFASGEGHGLANINPLEAIAGPCNVVCISKDSRNPQPSDEKLKAAEFIFYRAFDVQSCTILDKIDDEVCGLEIKYVFNRKEDEKIIPLPESTSDSKEGNTNIITSSEEKQLFTETVPDKLKDDAKGDIQDKDVPNLLEKNTNFSESDKLHDRPLKKIKSNDKKPLEEKCVEPEVARDTEKLTYMSSMKSKDEMKLCVVPVEKVENKEKNKTPTGSDKLHNRPLKKIKSDDKKPPEDMSSKKSAVESKLKHEEKVTADVYNLKASGTSGTTAENRKNGKTTGKVTDDLEDKKLKKTRDDGSFKIPDNKKMAINMNGSNDGKDLVASSAFSKGKSKSLIALDSIGNNSNNSCSSSNNNINNNKEAKEEQSGENKKKLSKNKSLKVSTLSNDKDKKNECRKFVVTPKPNAETSGWFTPLPWEDRLKNAYDQGTAILLHNVDPDCTSGEVEDIIWHAFNENCDAKILQHTAISSPHYVQALILLKTKEAAQRILTKLDEECLMLSNESLRPLVATPCPPLSTKKNSIFFGHLAIDKARFQNQREDEAVSTSHFSQPNTIEYDMAMDWCLLQLRSKKWWAKIHEQQGLELVKLENKLKQK